MLDLATLAGKIEEADRMLQQEAVEAARAINEREQDVLAFCRRLIAVLRVVLDEKRSGFPDQGWQAIVVSLLVKVIATVRAAHTVGAAGHAREIAVLVRSALETLITANATVSARCRCGVVPGGPQRLPLVARCVARHGVRSHPVPVALVGECSMPVV